MIYFKFVAIKDMHNIYYLGLSGERSLPFGLLVFVFFSFAFLVWKFDVLIVGLLVVVFFPYGHSKQTTRSILQCMACNL